MQAFVTSDAVLHMASQTQTVDTSACVTHQEHAVRGLMEEDSTEACLAWMTPTVVLKPVHEHASLQNPIFLFADNAVPALTPGPLLPLPRADEGAVLVAGVVTVLREARSSHVIKLAAIKVSWATQVGVSSLASNHALMEYDATALCKH